MSVADGGACILTSYILWVPSVLFLGCLPYRMKVTSRFLHFPTLDRKTSVMARCAYGLCMSQAILAFSFMSVDWTCISLILCQLVIAASWCASALVIHREVWRIAEWPGTEVRAFGFASIFVNLFQIVNIAPAGAAIIAVPILMLLATTCFLSVCYLKELAFTPAELDQIALDRVSVDIYDGHPIASSQLDYKEGLLGSRETTVDRPSVWGSPMKMVSHLLGRGTEYGDSEGGSDVRHDWFRVVDSEQALEDRLTSRFSMSSVGSMSSERDLDGSFSRTNTSNSSTSSSSMYDHHNQGSGQGLVWSALEKRSSSSTQTKGVASFPRVGSSGSGGGGSPSIIDTQSNNSAVHCPRASSKTVSRALENQRKQQQKSTATELNVASPALKTSQDTRYRHHSNISGGSRGNSKDGDGWTWSVKVERWAIRTAEKQHSSQSAVVSPSRDSLHSGGGTDRESELNSPNMSKSEENEEVKGRIFIGGGMEEEVDEVEFAIEITQYGHGGSETQSSPGAGIDSGTGWRDNRSNTKRREWTVWRTAAELLDMHDQMVASNGLSGVPRKPRLRGSLQRQDELAGDRKSICIYLATFLRSKEKDMDKARNDAPLPPVLMSFLEIRMDEALELSESLC